ncbi:hypothetical protein ABT133_35045, partial [Streptomyces sp. NPDC001835]
SAISHSPSGTIQLHIPRPMHSPTSDHHIGHGLSFLAELYDQQRDTVTKVIGDALAHDTLVAGGRYLGQLWLRDAETTAWHVLLARRRLHETEDDRKRFFEAWGNT